MRKIEKQMLAAIRNGKSFKMDNTEVTARTRWPSYYACEVKLHGRCIAALRFRSIISECPHAIHYSACGWNTRTTRSRINALFNAFGKSPRDGVHTSKGAMYRTQHGQEYAMESTAYYCYFIS